jgi:hypothetical protein
LILNLANVNPNIAVGYYVSGSGIDTGTRVAAIDGSDAKILTLSKATTAAITSGTITFKQFTSVTLNNVEAEISSVTLTLAAPQPINSDIGVGYVVTGAGIPEYTTVLGIDWIDRTKVYISQETTTAITAGSVTFAHVLSLGANYDDFDYDATCTWTIGNDSV